MVTVSLREAVNYETPGGYSSGVYVIRDGDTVFYVGQSDSIAGRLRQHAGIGEGFAGNIQLQELIDDNLPASAQWQVDLYGPCDFGRNADRFDKSDRLDLESYLIFTLSPIINASGKKQVYRDIPPKYGNYAQKRMEGALRAARAALGRKAEGDK